ncbi:MAG TPA: CinA family nicotinamide mononucleotide deamidase-related protein, partial [Polyangiaceae bacterium]|nr:CinA family nicotinamide mononucleotide deamidase-related protein [Polyangiaceae bacterium]
MSLALARVLSIGTELTRGEIDNTNASWLCERLTTIGLPVASIETVPDEPAAIVEALERLSQHSAVVVATGGLGPTTDDITSASVARWLGVPQRRDAEVLAALEQRLTRAGRTLTASSAQQADFPENAVILDNAHGTAPGFAVQRGACSLYFMPGVPREMRPMFERFVEPAARALVTGGQHQIRLRCFGVPESMLNDALAGLEAGFGVTLGYRVHFPEVIVKLLARRDSSAAAEESALAAAREARARLGDAVYAEGDADMPLVVGELARERRATLSLAESCTGGLVSSLLTQHPASDYLLGGVVSYDNAVKVAQLGVDPGLLAAHGAVSPEVARAMADGARQRFGSDLALSLTGI